MLSLSVQWRWPKGGRFRVFSLSMPVAYLDPPHLSSVVLDCSQAPSKRRRLAGHAFRSLWWRTTDSPLHRPNRLPPAADGLALTLGFHGLELRCLIARVRV